MSSTYIGNIRGPRGYSVASAIVAADNHLLLTMSNGTTIDAGDVRGAQGLPGVNAVANDTATAGYISTAGVSETKTALQAIFAKVITLAGPGIDPSGATDSTAAIQALINTAPVGSTIHAPHDATFTLSDTLTIGTRVRLTGGADLRWLSGITNKPAISITANGVVLDGLRLFNPNMLTSSTGSRNIGVYILASEVTVHRCHIELFQNGIMVAATGEFHDFIFTSNRIKDVIGGGDGPLNTTSAYGEDRGDGIMSWGASATIVGNVVNARIGSDARIGIHVERLSTYEVTPWVHGNALSTITGNVVYGPFRRGIVNEEQSYAVISGNTIADATWWGICLASAKHTVVSGNTIKWTRTSADVTGQAWAPKRAGIAIINGGTGNTITGNIVNVVAGASMPYGVYAKSEGLADDILIQDNSIFDPGELMLYGIFMEGTGNVRTRVRGNRIVGFGTDGLYGYATSDVLIAGNDFRGKVGAAKGIRLESSSSPATITGNLITNCTLGVTASNRTHIIVTGNSIRDATTGIDTFGCTAGRLTGNVLSAVTTGYANTSPSLIRDVSVAAPAAATGSDAVMVNACITALKKIGLMT